jgi:hypothetical protein
VTPFQRIAMGLVVVVLDARDTFDVLPDPLGWLLVLWGVAGLPYAERGPLRGSAGLALGVSVLFFAPPLHEQLTGADPALQWAASLPDLLFALLMARSVHRMARADDPGTARRVGALVPVVAVVAVAPVVIFPAGAEEDLLPAVTLVAQLCWLWLIGHLFVVSQRDWATA